ncbi:MAG: toxin-antitoxin system TumE family protein, partial [Halochromatium sp.]
GYKYRLALIVDEVCVLRYDNEAGKGDHKYLGEREMPYQCDGIDQLIGDCWADVSQQ